MFGFSIMKPPFSFTDIKTITYINSCFKFQRLLLKMYVEYIRNVKS